MNDRRQNNREEKRPSREFHEEFERIILGRVFADPEMFYDLHDRLRPEQFYFLRHQRIWSAMGRCVEKGKSPTRQMVNFTIDIDDRREETALPMFAAMLQREAVQSDTSQFESMVMTVASLGDKRALIQALQKSIMDIQAMDVDVPFEDMQDEVIRVTSGIASGTIDKDLRSYGDWGEQLSSSISHAFQNGGSEGVGLSVGLPSFEEVMGRLLPGKVYVIAGMSGGGKSAVARHITEAAALDAKQKGMGWGYIASMEMRGEEQAARAISEQYGLPAYKIENALLKQSEVDIICERGVKFMQGVPIMIDQRRRMTLDDIRTRMRKVKLQKGKLAFGVVDHALLLKFSNRMSQAESLMLAGIEIKGLAGEFDIPMIMLSQVDEKKIMESAKKEPNATNLFGSQGIKQSADSVCFIHRPELVLAASGPDRGVSEAEHQAKILANKDRAFFFNDKGEGARDSSVARFALSARQ